MSVANSVSLNTLTPDLILNIAAKLRLDERSMLRNVSRYCRDIISAPTHAELITAEVEDWAVDDDLLACGGCVSLRADLYFNHLMLTDSNWYSMRNHFVGMIGYPFMDRGGALAYLRFCNDCGRRPLPGSFRYQLGDYFRDPTLQQDVVRCKLCYKDALPPKGTEISWYPYDIPKGAKRGVCASCHGEVDDQGLPSLMDLPPKLHLTIAANLRLDERVALRKVSGYFKATISAPTHADLLTAEKEDWAKSKRLLACGGCVRLGRETNFAPEMKYECKTRHGWQGLDPEMRRGGSNAYMRFCNECGARELPGDFRYEFGAHWRDEKKERPVERCGTCLLEMSKAVDYVRCKSCKEIGEPPHCYHVGLCKLCYDEEKESRRLKEEERVRERAARSITTVDRLTTLDLDVLALVVSNLASDDQMRLRGVCTFFNEMIPRFIHEDLLKVELEEWTISRSLLACGGCVRLRHQSKFGYRVAYGDDWDFGGWMVPYRGGTEARKRYCNDCGIRDLPGEYRYPLGAHWLYDEGENKGAEFVRCKKCNEIEGPPEGIYAGLGETCYQIEFLRDTTPYSSSVLDAKFPIHIWKVDQYFGRPLIITLPPELILAIAEYLRLDELMLLRGASRFFLYTIPAPTHQQLLVVETEEWTHMISSHWDRLLACGGCQRLRSEYRFSNKFFDAYTSRGELGYPGFESGGPKADQRFCNECGVRKLPGDFRYWPGAHFSRDYEGKNETLVRCKRCGMDRRPPLRLQTCRGKHYSHHHIEVGLCEPCYVATHGTSRMKKNPYVVSKIEGLDAELIHAIIRHLEFPSRMTLRLVSHSLKYDISKPTHHQLFLAEQEEWAVSKRVLSCGGCVRLRHESKFNSRMLVEDATSDCEQPYSGMHRGAARGHRRFCNDCGVRDLPGKYRYQLGNQWYDEEKDKQVVRCKACGLNGEPPEGKEAGLCKACWSQELEDELCEEISIKTLWI